MAQGWNPQKRFWQMIELWVIRNSKRTLKEGKLRHLFDYFGPKRLHFETEFSHSVALSDLLCLSDCVLRERISVTQLTSVQQHKPAPLQIHAWTHKAPTSDFRASKCVCGHIRAPSFWAKHWGRTLIKHVNMLPNLTFPYMQQTCHCYVTEHFRANSSRILKFEYLL